MARNVVCVKVEGLGVVAVPQKMANKLAYQGIIVNDGKGNWTMDPEFNDAALAIPGSSILSRG